jgi:hypothetical protein
VPVRFKKKGIEYCTLTALPAPYILDRARGLPTPEVVTRRSTNSVAGEWPKGGTTIAIFPDSYSPRRELVFRATECVVKGELGNFPND